MDEDARVGHAVGAGKWEKHGWWVVLFHVIVWEPQEIKKSQDDT